MDLVLVPQLLEASLMPTSLQSSMDFLTPLIHMDLCQDSGHLYSLLEHLLVYQSKKHVWFMVSMWISGPTFGGVLYDAVTFRWAIFLIVIGELIALIFLVVFLIFELSIYPKAEYSRYQQKSSKKIIIDNFISTRLISNDEVADLPGTSVNYGSTGGPDNSRSVPVSSRTRKYSESVGRSYVASAVAR